METISKIFQKYTKGIRGLINLMNKIFGRDFYFIFVCCWGKTQISSSEGQFFYLHQTKKQKMKNKKK